MTPTKATRTYYWQALSEGVLATAYTNLKAHKSAQRHADKAREFWHKVEWQR